MKRVMVRWGWVSCILGLLCVGMGAGVRADGGMWPLALLKQAHYDTMKTLGLELHSSAVYDPMQKGTLVNAIVQFGNGCTGSVISREGLILTNHHCGHSYIQALSSVKDNYLDEGFVARTKKDELPAPGLTVTFMRSMRDVTDTLLSQLPDGLTERQRKVYIDSLSYELAQSTMNKNPRYDVSVKSFYEGNRYYMFTFETFSDVRLVLAPPSSIGSFGGDTDNWSYPRHTCDFSLFRVYAGPDNKPAPYSEDNVPYVAPRFLDVSLLGYHEGDFAMVLGYPGHTNRYVTSYELKNIMEIENLHRAAIRGVKLAIWGEHMDADPKVKIQYAAKYKQCSNYWKNAIGQNLALRREKVMEQKQREEQQFTNWIGQTHERTQKYLPVFPTMQGLVEKTQLLSLMNMYYLEALYLGVEFAQIYQHFNGVEKFIKRKDDEARKRLLAYVKGDLKKEWFKDYDAPTDKETAVAMITMVRELFPKETLPSFYDEVINKKYKGSVENYVDDVFKQSILVDYDRLVNFLEKPNLKKYQKDPGVQYCRSFFAAYANLYSMAYDKLDSITQMRRLYQEGLMEMRGLETMYPDANSTLRLSYGTVQGYDPSDAISYRYYTTLDGLVEKVDSTEKDFRVPEKLLTLHERTDYDVFANKEDGVMRVNFTTNNDITGGNSGSPVLDGRGNLIGLAFDGNWESLSSDMAFNPRLQRCISVDIRYVLFIIGQYSQASHILNELHLVRPPLSEVKK